MTEFETLRNKAQAGNPKAMFALALAYAQGKGTPPDPEQYFAWIKKAAEAGHKRAMFNLALAYDQGEGTPPDPEQCFAWTKKAAEAGVDRAMFNLALAYGQGRGTAPDTDQYFAWTKKAAETGHEKAMFNLALAYDKGRGTAPDTDQYFAWTKKAAEAGHNRAMYNLAVAYAQGEGTKPDIEQYFAWMKTSAEAGNNKAMYNLALAYKNGFGTKTDIKQYFTWLIKAAESGHMQAMFNLAAAYAKGNGTKPDAKQSFVWLKKAAEAGHPKAMLNLSMAYEAGDGTKPDIKQSFVWLKKSAEAGNDAAMFSLAIDYLIGNGTKKNATQYKLWMKNAAEAGEVDALLLHYINKTLTEHKLDKFETLENFVAMFSIVEEIKRDHTLIKSDSCVAHFTHFQTLEKMLPVATTAENSTNKEKDPNNHLRLYNVEYLNDPHEGCRLFQYMAQTKKYGLIYSSLFDSLDHSSPITALHEDLSVYVCSFTLRSDRLDLWRAYGTDGEGVCILTPLSAFDSKNNFHTLTDHFNETPRPSDTPEDGLTNQPPPVTENKINKAEATAPRVLYKVKYKDTDIKKTLSLLHPYLEAFTTLSATLSATKKEALRKCVIAVLSDILFLYKNSEYENEEEARMALAVNINNTMLKLDEQNPGKLFVKTENFLFKDKKSQIIIGPKVKDKKLLELNLKFRLTKHNLSNTKVIYSNVPYR